MREKGLPGGGNHLGWGVKLGSGMEEEEAGCGWRRAQAQVTVLRSIWYLAVT